VPHELEDRSSIGRPAEPIYTEIAGRRRNEPFATVVFPSGQIVELRIDVLRRSGRWEQSRETFERLGYLSDEERSDMWTLTADFERLHADLVDPFWLDGAITDDTTADRAGHPL
jgi:hypothetical protein